MAQIQPKRMVFPALIATAAVLFNISISITNIEASVAKQETSSINSQGSRDFKFLNLPESVAPWEELIRKYSAIYELSPDLIAAVIWQESNGNPNAFSSSGAVGLMQVMPRDGIAADFLCGSSPCFADRPSAAELRDPDFNIDYGSKLLNGYIKKYGSEREGLYHYGPMDIGYYYADLVLSLRNKL